jgi:hypothetical protein
MNSATTSASTRRLSKTSDRTLPKLSAEPGEKGKNKPRHKCKKLLRENRSESVLVLLGASKGLDDLFARNEHHRDSCVARDHLDGLEDARAIDMLFSLSHDDGGRRVVVEVRSNQSEPRLSPEWRRSPKATQMS